MKLIAETAWHHDGDYKFFKNLVLEICNKTKADYIKFHVTLDLDEYMHIDHPAYSWAKEKIFSKEQWEEIFNLTRESGKKLMLLFNDTNAIEFGLQFKPELVEIHSVCLNDTNLLKSLYKYFKGTYSKVVLGIGGTDLYEIEHALQYLKMDDIIMMHGFQNYPTQYNDINFSKIKKIMDLYPYLKHGYADHTAWNHENNVLITLFGAAMGMEYIEKHVTTAPGEERTDWQAAISIEKFVKIEEKLKVLEEVKGDGLLKMNKGEEVYSTFGKMKKAAILAEDVSKGDKLQLKQIRFKRTGQNSNLSQVDVIKKIGKIFTKDISRGSIINREDLK